MWERWLPDFQWRPMRGGLCSNEEFEKALDEIRLDTDHPAAASLWSEMLVQGALGRDNEGRRAARASSSSSGSLRARSSTFSSPGQVRIRVAQCRAAGSRHIPDSAGGLHGRRAKSSRRGEEESEYKQILVPF